MIKLYNSVMAYLFLLDAVAHFQIKLKFYTFKNCDRKLLVSKMHICVVFVCTGMDTNNHPHDIKCIVHMNPKEIRL